jgi:predicted kinase
MSAILIRTMIAMAGLPGTGKSTLAEELARRFSAVVLSKDIIRAQLFSPDHIDFSREQDDLCMKIMFVLARHLLQSNPERAVIIDGRTFSKSYQVRQFLFEAESLNAKPLMIECICDEDVARERLDRAHQAGSHPATNRTFQLYKELKEAAEAITIEHLVIDTSRELIEKCVERCLEYLKNK